MFSAITSEVRDGELSIGLVDNTDLGLNELDEIEYQVTLRDLRGLRVNGVARVVATEIDTPQLDVTIGGVFQRDRIGPGRAAKCLRLRHQPVRSAKSDQSRGDGRRVPV